ncbi:MAG: hypothetical protein H6561_11580 [Lewinellaceae bacterium]|nr:hypothetical protein [Lewinellaceae bacterium]
MTAATDGRMFVANNAGLLEFDGNRWVLHYLPHKQTVRTVVVCAEDGSYLPVDLQHSDIGKRP